MAPQVDSFQLTVGSDIVDRNLGFLANGFVVDNLTNQWIFLSQPFVFVPPYTVAISGPMPGVQKITARFLAPIGFSQAAQISGQQAGIRSTAGTQPSSPGVAIAPAPTYQSVFLRQVGSGGIDLVGATPGKTVFVFSLLISVDTINAGGFALIANGTTTIILAQITCAVLGSVCFASMNGTPLLAGDSLRLSVLTGGNAGCTAIFQLQ